MDVNDSDDVTMDMVLVRRLIDERKWTWADLAREMGMSKSTVSRVTRYNTRPGRKFIFALRRVFPEHRDALFAAVPPPEQRAAGSERLAG